MQALLDIGDESHVGDARRRVASYVTAWQLPDELVANASLVATELATNLVHHARGGKLYLQRLHIESEPILEIVAVDNGPGMRSVAQCMQDGFSTRGSAGTGLGAVRRHSVEFEAYSVKDQGSVVMSRLGTPAAGRAVDRQSLRFGAYGVPVRGESVSGDAWRLKLTPRSWSFLVADGLGHGPQAAEAAGAVAAAFDEADAPTPVAVLEAANRKAAGTRGAAAAIAHIDPAKASATFAGIGNITAKQVTPARESGMISQNGTVGLQMRQLRSFTYPWERAATLLMYSDGIQSRANLNAYPGILESHPSILAALIARDFARGNDDVTVLTARAKP